MNTAGGPPVVQPESFEFTPENLERAKAHIAKYPPGRQASAVLPLPDLAQRYQTTAEMLGQLEEVSKSFNH